MGHQRIMPNECYYKEKDRSPKEQFINGINDADKMTDKIRELTTTKRTNEITSEQALGSPKRAEAQRGQKAILE